ncbi:DMT family transporter [Pedobacter sp. SYSU D00535]|uniref:DMT family transporter n=1 Tax=Pedobacter sp. SYSU D00535 TaxID=2810308 RepID=UPI001A960BC2|nr:EamA family transporter [Pedobacter sp. SYSU D00535]
MEVKLKAYLALAFICIVWGTTYLAVRVGVQDFPPFLFMGMRQSMAGILLFAFVIISGKRASLNWSTVRLQIVPGICMITFGNGIVAWAVQYIPSGIAALICSMIPLYVILINLMINRKERPNWQIILGTILGLAGIVLIFRDHLLELKNREYLAGIIITIASCISWAAGTIYTQKNKSASDPILNASIQLFIGGAALLLISTVFEKDTVIPMLSGKALFAWIYLVLFGSVAAFAAYLYALSKLPVALVTAYAYINPLVAVILGFLLLNEQINRYTVLAALVIVCGVYLVNSGYRLQHKS